MNSAQRLSMPLRFAAALRALLAHPGCYPLMLCWLSLRTRSFAPLRAWCSTRAITRSRMFERQWYLENNPDVAASGMDPVLHYVLFGAKERRDPSSYFSTHGYL